MSNVENKQQKTKKKLIITISIIAVVALASVGVVIWSLMGGFDASAYTDSVLQHKFMGKTSQLSEMVDGIDKTALEKQYQAGVSDFVTHYFADIVADEELQGQCVTLGTQLFGKAKFRVLEAEKVSRKEYRVSVEYEPMDVLAKYETVKQQGLEVCTAKMQKGEYKGTVDEIQAQLVKEYAGSCYTGLEALVKEAGYSETESVVLTVKKDENGVFGLDSTELSQLMGKIMGLDAIQD